MIGEVEGAETIHNFRISSWTAAATTLIPTPGSHLHRVINFPPSLSLTFPYLLPMSASPPSDISLCNVLTQN